MFINKFSIKPHFYHRMLVLARQRSVPIETKNQLRSTFFDKFKSMVNKEMIYVVKLYKHKPFKQNIVYQKMIFQFIY